MNLRGHPNFSSGLMKHLELRTWKNDRVYGWMPDVCRTEGQTGMKVEIVMQIVIAVV